MVRVDCAFTVTHWMNKGGQDAISRRVLVAALSAPRLETVLDQASSSASHVSSHHTFTSTPCRKRILAGAMTGATGQAIASPTDVVKVRLQADGRLRALGQAPRYNGTLDAFRRIPKEEGIGGFFKGIGECDDTVKEGKRGIQMQQAQLMQL
jgi:hypothetical protein